jgi:hypothetical protein
MGYFNKCCCSCPSLANTTTVLDAGQCDGCVAAPDKVVPYTRGDLGCDCTYPAHGPCTGPWDQALWKAPQTFAVKTPPTTPCPGTTGQKLAVAKKIHQGRNGFVQDYIADPKGATTHCRAYAVSVNLSTSAHFTTHFLTYPDSNGSIEDTTGSNSGAANSTHSMTVGGIEDCTGSASAGDGSETTTQTTDGVTTTTDNCWTVFFGAYPGELLLPSDTCGMVDPDGKRAANISTMEGLCSIDCDRGNLSIHVPSLGSYNGPISGFAGWLASFEYNIDQPLDCNSGIQSQSWRTVTFSGGFSNTSLAGTVTVESYAHQLTYYSSDNSGDCSSLVLYDEETAEIKSIFTFTATLSAPYTFAQAQADATALLNNFDFTNDKDFPWTMPADCRIAPMISLWEGGGSPGSGYCDTPADPATLAIYDGSVKGALINYYTSPAGPKYQTGIYTPGWFDWAMDIYHSSDDDLGGQILCYGYGSYPGGICGVTMATQVTTGSMDTSNRAGCTPFSRYYNFYVLPFRPPHVDVSCGFAGDGGDAVYVSKYAEKKVPLPSENFFGPCGAMRSQTLNDDHCNPYDPPQLRFPGAWSICGKARVASIARDSGSGVVTVTLTDPADALITGDAVDFLGASNAVTTANVTATVDSSTQFHFNGALPTGVAIKSHGAPDPAWYNLNPKGDFIWGFSTGNAYDGTNVQTISQDNLAQTGGILFVGPPGSPEINNPKWPAKTTRIQSGYPALAPGGHWYCNPQQAMTDRWLTDHQDNQTNDGDTPPGACTRLMPPLDYPLVEAVAVAPHNAPYAFSPTDPNWPADGNGAQPLPTPDGLNFKCSGIWNATDKFSGLGYSTWPGTIQGSGALASQDVTGASASDNITNLGPA